MFFLGFFLFILTHISLDLLFVSDCRSTHWVKWETETAIL